MFWYTVEKPNCVNASYNTCATGELFGFLPYRLFRFAVTKPNVISDRFGAFTAHGRQLFRENIRIATVVYGKVTDSVSCERGVKATMYPEGPPAGHLDTGFSFVFEC
jgi:hypothetical protein